MYALIPLLLVPFKGRELTVLQPDGSRIVMVLGGSCADQFRLDLTYPGGAVGASFLADRDGPVVATFVDSRDDHVRIDFHRGAIIVIDPPK